MQDSRPPDSRSSLPRRLAVAAAALVAALLAGEIAVRAVESRGDAGSLDSAFERARGQDRDPGRRVALIDILRRSPDERVIFELRPNLKGVPFKDAPVTTNSHGFRGPEMPKRPPPGTITIVGIGDSVMFGYGLPDGHDYMSGLERRLNARYPGKTWRCVNAAAPAYNTVNEVALLASRYLDFEPDLVIVGLVPNDLALPPFIREDVDFLALDRSFLFERVAAALSGSRPSGDGRNSGLLFVDGKRDWQRIPERYRALAGFDAFREALAELDELSRRHRFEVVTFMNTDDEVGRRMVHAASRFGWLHVSLLPEINAFLAQHNGGVFSAADPSAYLQSPLALSPSDGHPSALQNVMAADKLFSELERSGLIARLLAK